jgi:hypothetical protein
MAAAKKILIGCLVAAAGFVLLIVVLFAAYVAWGIYANDRAETEARGFCQATRPGEMLEHVLERAKGPNPPDRYGNDSDGVYHFYWYGMIFNAQECAVTTAKGRVVSAQVIAHDD